VLSTGTENGHQAYFKQRGLTFKTSFEQTKDFQYETSYIWSGIEVYIEVVLVLFGAPAVLLHAGVLLAVVLGATVLHQHHHQAVPPQQNTTRSPKSGTVVKIKREMKGQDGKKGTKRDILCQWGKKSVQWQGIYNTFLERSGETTKICPTPGHCCD
jgi:hypothetical protein